MFTRPLACIEYTQPWHDGKTISVFGKGSTRYSDDSGGTASGFRVPPLAPAVEGPESLKYQRFRAFRFPENPARGNGIGNKKFKASGIDACQSLPF